MLMRGVRDEGMRGDGDGPSNPDIDLRDLSRDHQRNEQRAAAGLPGVHETAGDRPFK